LKTKKVEKAWTGQLNAKNVMATEVLKESAKMTASTVPYYSIQSYSCTYFVKSVLFFHMKLLLRV